MSPRSIRRAVERKALKEARKDEASRLAANQANAQLSTGPRTPEGKAKSSVNAKDEAALLSEPKIQGITALTGRTVLLPTDDVAAYQRHIRMFAEHFQPVGPAECELVQTLADHDWRLKRIASLEMAIYAYGHEQFADQFTDRGHLQSHYAQMHTFLHYEKQLRNLQLQESRIRRHRDKDTAELNRLQNERRATSDRTPSVSESVTPAATPSNGFVFSSQSETELGEVEWLPLDTPWAGFPRPKTQSEATTAA